MRNFEKDFSEWLINVFFSKGDKVTISHRLRALSFKNNPFSMQWGVYVDFFDEKGILIEDLSNWDGCEKHFDWAIRTDNLYRNEDDYYTRNESQKAAYEKAKEIYEQLNQEQ
mgnify:CR=1 FL=1